MARSTLKNFTAANKAPFNGRFFGLPSGIADKDYDNAFPITWSDSADVTSVHGIMVDSDSRVRHDRQAILGGRIPLTFSINANATISSQAFFIAPIAMTIFGVTETHATAGNDAAAVTGYVEKLTGTTAPASGTSVMSGTFNLKGTANTTQFATLASVNPNGTPNAVLELAAGDRLGFVTGGVLTTLAGLQITVWVAPGFKGMPAIYNMKANGSIATQSFFEANRDCVVTGVQAVWSAAGTDAGAVTIDVIKDTGTSAPGAGTTVLAAALSVKTTANTVASPALAASAATLQLAAGDRLAFKLTGTPTALAGVVVVVWLTSVGATGYYGQIDPTYAVLANGTLATQTFFTADRDYEIVDFSEVHSVAGNDGSAVTLDLTVDKGTTAPGAGATALAGTANLKATANTTIVPGVSTSRRARLLSKGDRLSVKFTGVLTTLAGVTATASLRPI